MKVRLTKRFAEMINGIDLSRVKAGDVLELSPRDAGVLLAEGWALPADSEEVEVGQQRFRAEGADRSRVRW